MTQNLGPAEKKIGSRLKFFVFAVVSCLLCGAAHSDPVTPLLLGLSLILIFAKAGGHFAVWLKQPAVLGELAAGIFLGNAVLLGFNGFEFLRPRDGDVVASTIDMLSRLGVILLLFEVGLDTRLEEMKKVGLSSFLVATVGVVAPMGIGWLVSSWFLPNESWHVHLFIGATLCATSVGITARVFKDLGKTHLAESKIVLGAAVIDDVMGLVVLAVVQAIILSGSASPAEVAVIVGKAVFFLVGAVVLGGWASPRLFNFTRRLRGSGLMMVTGLLICLLLSWTASIVGLAPIVGAFAAGLILEESHYQTEGEKNLEEWVLPVNTIMIPIFFVMMGFLVDLRSFTEPSLLGEALAITVAAIIGKQVCGLAVTEKSVDRLSVGIGMIPRGEVGLIFAAIGLELVENGHPVISQQIYTAIVIMVVITTVMTPPLLNWSLNRRR